MKKFLLPVLFLCAQWCVAQIDRTGNPLEDVPFVEYKLGAGCNRLLYETGSQISIPDQAFEGCPNHEVTLRYRELTNKEHMVRSGVPMNYEEHLLESGGMFEVYAECNGQSIDLAEGKEIQVKFASDNQLEDMEAFLFNPEKQEWELVDNEFSEVLVATPSENDDQLWSGQAPLLKDGEEGPSSMTRTKKMFCLEYTTLTQGKKFECVPPNKLDSLLGVLKRDEQKDQNYVDSLRAVRDEMLRQERERERVRQDSLRQIEQLKEDRRIEVFRSMNIDKMGLYNYDRMIKEEETVPLLAKFKFQGKGWKDDVFVVYDGLNTVVRFSPSDFETRFALFPRNDLQIFVILKNGEVAKVSEQTLKALDFEKLKSKGTFTFVLKEDASAKGLELLAGQ